MVSFEIFGKAMLTSLSELKVLPSFCFAFKIPDDVAASNTYKTRQRRAYTFHLMMEACALSRIMRACLTVLNLDGAAHVELESFIKEH